MLAADIYEVQAQQTIIRRYKCRVLGPNSLIHSGVLLVYDMSPLDHYPGLITEIGDRASTADKKRLIASRHTAARRICLPDPSSSGALNQSSLACWRPCFFTRVLISLCVRSCKSFKLI